MQAAPAYTAKEHFHTRDIQVGFGVVPSFSKIIAGTFMLFLFNCEGFLLSH